MVRWKRFLSTDKPTQRRQINFGLGHCQHDIRNCVDILIGRLFLLELALLVRIAILTAPHATLSPKGKRAFRIDGGSIQLPTPARISGQATDHA